MAWHCFHQHGNTFPESKNLSQPVPMTVSPKGRESMFDAFNRGQNYEPSNTILRAKPHMTLGAATEVSLPNREGLLVTLCLKFPLYLL